ncbi:MAG: hypothetical protein KGP28_08420 [Bdellovibrionales bacterium]|nr:hypothetical protein [Bdellovibrionales bacterium]
MKTLLRNNEQIVKKGVANLQKGFETVGGSLILTNQRLVFEPHKINVQRGPIEIEIHSIQAVAKVWTKFLNLIPLIPNSLEVHTRAGQKFRFVLFGRDSWKREIESRR